MPANHNIVELRGQQAFTTSLIVADQCDLTHGPIIRRIRQYQSDFEELGKVSFENRLNTQGSPTEIAILNEDQATYLITLSRNTQKVRRFKLALVKAFRKAIDEINRLYANPPRKGIILDKRHAHHPMMDALIEQREDLGKETAPKHFMCENKLCNWAVTGVFAAIDEADLSNEDAELLAFVRKRNEAFMLSGLDYYARKIKLAYAVTRWRSRQQPVRLVAPPDKPL